MKGLLFILKGLLCIN